MLGIRSPEQVIRAREQRSNEVDQLGEKIKALTPDQTAAIDLSDNPGFTSRLASTIATDWQRNRDDKTRVEISMLECLRERKGEYSPEERAEIQKIGAPDVYIKLAAAKCRAGRAHAKAILMPAGSRAHGIEPTPNPELPEYAKQAIIDRVLSNPNATDEQGQSMDPMQQVEALETMVRREMQHQAKDAARKMDRRMNDQLVEGGWREALSAYIDDYFTYQAAFMKGPYVATKPRLKWVRGRDGKHRSQTTMQKILKWRTIDPFDAYPGAGADSVHDAPFLERLRLTQHELFNMIGLDGYNEKAIRDVLQDYSNGFMQDWLWTESQRMQISEHQYWWYQSTTGYDGLHWYGRAAGRDLVEWGMKESDLFDIDDEYEIDAILMGRHVIKASVNPDPLFRRPLGASSYDKINGSVFGQSPSMLMRSTTRVCNGTARALMMNMAHTAGFQMEVDYERLSPETNPLDVHPYKLWQFRESMMTGDRPGVRFFQPRSNTSEYLTVMDHFKKMADNDTGIPEFLHGGSEGADSTARGRAMLLDQSAKLLREAISHIDEDIVRPMLKMLYDFNMQYDPDESIKGDAQIVARGANAMLQRESARTAHMALAEMIAANPRAQQIVGLEGEAYLYKHLIGTFDDIDGDLIIPSGEELDMRLKEIQAQQPPPDPKITVAEMQMQVEAQKLQFEAQRMQQADAQRVQDGQSDRALEMMRTKAKIEVARTQAEADVERTRIEAEQRYQANESDHRSAMSVMRFKIAEESKYRIEFEKLKRQLDAPVDQVQEQPISNNDIAKIVTETIERQLGDISLMSKDIVDSIKSTLQNQERVAESGDITLNVNMPDSKPSSKKITAKRDAQGNLVGEVTPS